MPLFCFMYFADTQPFMVAVYQGVEKPTTKELIGEVVEELKSLKYQDAAVAEERGFYVKLRQIRADRPARSTLKCTTNASGYCSCERCKTFGMPGEEAKGSRNVAVRPGEAAEEPAGSAPAEADAAPAEAGAAPAQAGAGVPSASVTHAVRFRKTLKRLQPKPRKTPASGEDDASSSAENSQRPKRKRRRRAAAIRATKSIQNQQHASEAVDDDDETAPSSGSKTKDEGRSTNVVFPEMTAPARANSEWTSYLIGVKGGPDNKLVSQASEEGHFS
jgi:hypothetical protein